MFIGFMPATRELRQRFADVATARILMIPALILVAGCIRHVADHRVQEVTSRGFVLFLSLG